VAPVVRGLRQATEGAPVLLYLDRDSARALGVQAGSRLTLLAGGRRLSAQVAGELEHFPTLEGSGERGFAVADLGRLVAMTAASPGGAPVSANEAWLRSSSPTETAHALAGAAGVESVTTLEGETAALGEARRFAAGWYGVLWPAAWSALALSALAVFCALPARGAGAGLRLLVVLPLGLAAGVAAGAWLTSWFASLLGVDQAGRRVVPPIDAGIEDGTLLVALAAIAAAVLVAAATQAVERLRAPERPPEAAARPVGDLDG
jgi:hypothetical protein